MATYQAKVLTPWRSEPGCNDILVAEEYPAAWTDITWQADPLIGADRLNRLVALGEGLSATQVAAIRADARFAVLSVQDEAGGAPPPALEPLETVRTELAAVLSSDVARLVVEDVVPATADALVSTVKEVVLHPPWQVGLAVTVGQVFYRTGNLYEVIQGHTTQADWPPERAPALFKRYYEPTDDPWPWVQPLGAHDAYPLGARVTHGGYTWRSNIAANVWEPGSVGAEALWENLTPPPPPPPLAAWAYPVAYKGDNTAGAGKGDVVTHNGRRYRCWQTHTSQIGWEPPKVPALWIDLGPI